MSEVTTKASGTTVDELLAFNETLFEQHKRLGCFQLFNDGTLDDPVKREMFFACLQVFARHFQTTIFMRQAHCADDRYGALFARHLREEVGHDDILRKDRGRADEVWDPVIEGSAAWLISRMAMLDNVEKLAVVHLVLESSGANMGFISREVMRKYGGADYFGLHDEIDTSHVDIALAPLRRQPPETIARVKVVIDQAWQVLNVLTDRVEALVRGRVKASLYVPNI